MITITVPPINLSQQLSNHNSSNPILLSSKIYLKNKENDKISYLILT